MGRLTPTDEELMHKRKDNFFSWLDKNPTRAANAQRGTVDEMLNEYNTANTSLPLKHKKKLIRWLFQYRQANEIKPTYHAPQRTEYLRGLAERYRERAAKIEACLA